MKKRAIFGLISVGVLFLIVYLSSCQKNDTTPPAINFSNASVYTYEDTTLAQGTVFTIYVSASKAGVDQHLDTGIISYSLNGSPDSVVQTMRLSSVQFNQYYSYKAGLAGNKEKYTFTFGQTNGLFNSKSVTIKDTSAL